MAITAENCAKKYGITREAADAFALRSQRWRTRRTLRRHEGRGRAGRAQGPQERHAVEQDDHMRPETTMEVLAKLPAAFKKDGVVTAGNASGIVDGAAALVIAGEAAVKACGVQAARDGSSRGPSSASSRR